MYIAIRIIVKNARSFSQLFSSVFTTVTNSECLVTTTGSNLHVYNIVNWYIQHTPAEKQKLFQNLRMNTIERISQAYLLNKFIKFINNKN